MSNESEYEQLWEDGAAIDFRADNGVFILQGNAAELRTLSRMLIDLSQRKHGAHQHLEDFSGLNLGSLPLVLIHNDIQPI